MNYNLFKSLHPEGDVNFSTNVCSHYNLQHLPSFCEESKQFIQNNLRTTSSFKEIYEEKMKDVPEKYSVIQLRLGDPVGPKEIPLDKMNKIRRTIDQIPKDQTIYVMSDNTLIRDRIASIYNFQTLGVDICHIGDRSDLKSTQGTLLEFFLIAKSSKVYQISFYPRPSGFAVWACKLYDVEIQIFQV